MVTEELSELDPSLEQKSFPERESPLEQDSSLKIPRIHAVEGKNLQGRIHSYLLDKSRAPKELKRQIDDHIHTQDSSHNELFPHLRADENMLQILNHSFPEENRVRLLNLQDELCTFIHLLEAVEEEAVKKKGAEKEAAMIAFAKEKLLEKEEASIGGVYDRVGAHVNPEAVEEEVGKQLPRNCDGQAYS